VKRRNCLSRAFFFHHDKPEAFGSTRASIRDNAYRFDCPTLLERTGEIAFRRLERQISKNNFLDIQFPSLFSELPGLIGED